MLRPRGGVNVEVTNTRISVEGRVYEAQHVILIGARKAHIVIEPENIRINASFPDFPSIDMVGGDVVKIYREGAKYQVDMFGDSISAVRTSGNNIIIEGDIVTIKFERDEEVVNVTLPRIGKATTRKLEITSETATSINIIIIPFTVGVVNIYGKAMVKIRKDLEATVIEASGANT
ncbi:MAG: hypothetical protein GSR86_03990 [Desulfurococcales archaeon]|nr:hypothetical protein [Desulfurococcales archaeon]